MAHGAEPTVNVRVAVLLQRWEQLTFLHWPTDPDAVQRLLPSGLRVQTFEGEAWVSLVPFEMRVILPGDRVRLPVVGHFAETNVRTYVTADDGTEGIWFFSLDASSRLAVAGGRGGYRLAYMHSTMSVDRSSDVISYSCIRRWPALPAASSRMRVQLGAAYTADDLSERDHWLSARWRLYSHMFGRLWGAKAYHEPWPLRRATLLDLDDNLVAAAGLPRPGGDPIVQFSEGVGVRIGAPYVVRR